MLKNEVLHDFLTLGDLWKKKNFFTFFPKNFLQVPLMSPGGQRPWGMLTQCKSMGRHDTRSLTTGGHQRHLEEIFWKKCKKFFFFPGGHRRSPEVTRGHPRRFEVPKKVEKCTFLRMADCFVFEDVNSDSLPVRVGVRFMRGMPLCFGVSHFGR